MPVSVRYFGAIGNGVADDTAAVQAAINSIYPGSVFLPPGDYSVSSLLMRPGVTIEGESPSASRLVARSNSTSLLRYVASGTLREHFGVRRLGFRSNGRTGVQAVSIDGGTSSVRASRIRLENLDFEGSFARAVNLRFCANSFLSNLFISQAVDGIYVDQCADTDIQSSKIQLGAGYGVSIMGGPGPFDEGVRLLGVSTNGQHYGMRITGQDWGLATACSFTTCPGGALIANGATNWKFGACEFAPAGSPVVAAGINVGGDCSDFVFDGGQVVLATFGIVLRGERHVVKGMTFKANSNVDVYLDGAQRCVVVGNICDSSAQPWSVLEYGGADLNNLYGNVVNGSVVKSGGLSQATGNLVY